MLLQTELGDLASYDGDHHRAHPQLQEPANYARIESGLTFLGLAGLMDPPRPEVPTRDHFVLQQANEDLLSPVMPMLS